ncbi:MAG TPA: hypothetical protein VGO90_04445, partial [Chthoniobacteraceae bacterium]|nr:hypothetical protein [Chthoniobacteraceae bacterium]
MNLSPFDGLLSGRGLRLRRLLTGLALLGRALPLLRSLLRTRPGSFLLLECSLLELVLLRLLLLEALALLHRLRTLLSRFL